MSEIKVTSLESTGSLSAPTITAGNTTINSTGLYLNKTESDYSGVIDSTSLTVSASDLDYTTSAEFNNSSDSYTAGLATITNFDTYIRLTATGIDPTLTSPAFSYRGTQIGKIIIKIRRIAGSGWDGSVFYSTAGHGFSESFKFNPSQPAWVGTNWAYIQLDGNKLFAGDNDFINSTITQMRFDFGNSASDIFEIDYIRFYPVNILSAIVSVPSITVNGTSYSTLPSETVNTQIFTANGTWTKPSWATTGNELVITHLWGGGGTGYVDISLETRGGGGGAFVFGYFKSSFVTSTVSITVGSGGVVDQVGGSSIFAANSSVSLIAYGGGNGNTSTSGGGGGGGWLSAGFTGTSGGTGGGNPLGTGDSTFGGGGGGGGSGNPGRASIYGGGGGAGPGGTGGNSVFGGAGGSANATPRTSIYGGFGGNSSIAPTTPGGGGGGSSNPAIYAGARGEVRVYTLRVIA